jgi:hypothetical protein
MGHDILCGGNTVINTGTGSCLPEWNDIVGAFLVRPGVEFDKTLFTAASSSALVAKVISGEIMPLPRLQFSAVNNEKTLEKNVAGQIKKLREGERRADFVLLDIFGCVQKALTALNGGKWAVVFIDSVDNVLGREGATTTKIKGINLTDIYFTKPQLFVEYGAQDQQMLSVTVNPNQLDDLYSSKMGFPFDDVSGITSSVVAKVAFTTSKITVSVKESCNASAAVTDLLIGNFSMSQGGVAGTITGVTESTVTPGTYELAGTFTENPAVVNVVPTATAMYQGTATIAFV